MNSFPKIGFVAPSSAVPPYEFELGLERLKGQGLSFQVHSQCKKKWLFFAGTDAERAKALIEYAYDPTIEAIWCARGGYGAYRLLPWLDSELKKQGAPPKKMILGYSDTTCLLDYARTRWQWNALHAPMPGLNNFLDLGKKELSNLLTLLRGERPKAPFGTKKLKFAGAAPTSVIEAELVGGQPLYFSCCRRHSVRDAACWEHSFSRRHRRNFFKTRSNDSAAFDAARCG